MEYAPDRQPWDQQPGEDDYWFAQFGVFLRMGPGRSLLGAYKRSETRNRKTEKDRKRPIDSAPPTWREACGKYEWSKRCAAYDKDIIEEERANELAERRRDRRSRINAAKKLRRKALDLMKKDKFAKLFFSDIAVAIKTSAAELRAEFGEEQAAKAAVETAAPSFNITLKLDLSQYPVPAVTVTAPSGKAEK